VRALLLDTLEAPDALEVLERVAEYIDPRIGQARDFPARIRARSSDGSSFVERNRAFALFAAEVLRRLGYEDADLLGLRGYAQSAPGRDIPAELPVGNAPLPASHTAPSPDIGDPLMPQDSVMPHLQASHDSGHDVYKPELRAESVSPFRSTGAQIGRYKLGAQLGQSGFYTAFEIEEPTHLKGSFVIKVLQRSSPSTARRFLAGARFNHELCNDAFGRPYIVEVTEIIDEGPHLAYVMPKYGRTLENYLTSDFHASPHAIAWTEHVAAHIGRALQVAHARGHAHGDLRPANILVNIKDAAPVFRLGDFDLHRDAADESTEIPFGIVPSCLSRKAWYGARDPSERDSTRWPYLLQWHDIAALSLILYRMLTGEIVHPLQATQLREQINRLRVLACEPQIAVRAQRLINTLIETFDDTSPPLTIDAFLRNVQRPTDRQQLRILFLGANPSADTRLALTREVAEIREWIRYGAASRDCHIEERWETQVDRLHLPILEVEPDIVHFSCHNNDAGQLVFHGPGGEATTASIETVTNVFRFLAGYVRCVVLSACYSEKPTRLISEHIDVVIGIPGTLREKDAIRFAGSFYGTLCLGAHLQDAFELACNTVKAASEDLRRSRRDVKPERPPVQGEPAMPRLHVRPGFDAKTLYFVKRKSH
jgi:hypothetical protein